jgi:NAD(P)-dependent dehydrogenase (short-subunit alcohol dehydrogenase family)
MQDFEGRTAVITGSASGMGLAFAEGFGRLGMNVVMADIEEAALKTAAARVEALGATVLPVVTDVGDATSMDQLGEAAREAFGAVHLVCLNAGVSAPTVPMDELSANDWKWTLDVNLFGVAHGIRVFLPGLKAQDEGSVVITASVAGLTSHPWLAPYNASKHAAVAIAETLHAELANVGSKVTVHCLCPGMVATNIGSSERNRPKELQDEVANVSNPEAMGDLAEHVEEFVKIAQTPDAVAERVLEAVVEGRFWIETDAYYRETIVARHRSIENRTAPPVAQSVMDPYFSK